VATGEDAARRSQRTREIAREVLTLAFGASATPFVPVPFLDDVILGRLLRRIAGKVLARHGVHDAEIAKTIADAYVEAGSPSTGASIVTGAIRFVVRKVAVVMDVKKSHDVFGQSIALALALDVAAERGVVNASSAAPLGAAIHRALERVGSGPLDALVRASREAFAAAGSPPPENATRLGQLANAIGVEVDRAREHIEAALGYEWPMAGVR